MMDSLLQQPSILAGIGVFLLGAIILMVLVYVRGKKKNDSNPQTDTPNEGATQIIGADTSQNQGVQQVDSNNNNGDLPQLENQSPLNNPVAQPQDTSMAGQPTVGDTPNVQNIDNTTPMEQTNFGTESLDNAVQPNSNPAPIANDPAANNIVQSTPTAMDQQQPEQTNTQVVDLGGNNDTNPAINELAMGTDNSSQFQTQENSAPTTDAVSQSNTFETVVGGPQADVPQFATDNLTTPGQEPAAQPNINSQPEVPTTENPTQLEPQAGNDALNQTPSNPIAPEAAVKAEPSSSPVDTAPNLMAAVTPTPEPQPLGGELPAVDQTATAPTFDINQPNTSLDTAATVQTSPTTPAAAEPTQPADNLGQSLPDISAIETNATAADQPVPAADPSVGIPTPAQPESVQQVQTPPAQPAIGAETNSSQPGQPVATTGDANQQPGQPQNAATANDLTDLGLPPI